MYKHRFAKPIENSVKMGMFALAVIFSNPLWADGFSDVFNGFFQSACTLSCPHWYVGSNIGVSHLYDKKTPNTFDSVNQNGPGWNVNGGLQLNNILGAEVGYTKYHDSRETIGTANAGSITIAKTEHYSAYVAATARFPFYCQFAALGKLGVAYSYANKIFTLGPSFSSGSVSLYYGLGLEYVVTPAASFVAEWNSARGNNYTGSADLYSLGVVFNLI